LAVGRQTGSAYSQIHISHNNLAGPNLQVENFAVLALEEDLHGPAANLTINRELLRRLGGVHRELECLPTIWTLDFFRFLHLPDERKIVIVRRSD
jgi:hypothetical protein